jgi:hypothetical protein
VGEFLLGVAATLVHSHVGTGGVAETLVFSHGRDRCELVCVLLAEHLSAFRGAAIHWCSHPTPGERPSLGTNQMAP